VLAHNDNAARADPWSRTNCARVNKTAFIVISNIAIIIATIKPNWPNAQRSVGDFSGW
jgi:hypothetical protein